MSRFIQGRLIGSGTYAKVYMAMDNETNTTVALKVININQDEGMPGTALREISLLQKLKHRNIVELKTVVHKENSLTMVFEYVTYDLTGYLKTGPVNKPYLVNQILSGICFIHSKSIIHRDLKPTNILVTQEGVIKIADFGLARALHQGDFPYSSEVVTLWYRAPELILGKTDYGFEIDMWSFGCIVYEIYSLRPLFPGENKAMQLRITQNLNFAALKHQMVYIIRVPDFFINIVCKSLQIIPDRRLSAYECVKFLEETYRNK